MPSGITPYGSRTGYGLRMGGGVIRESNPREWARRARSHSVTEWRPDSRVDPEDDFDVIAWEAAIAKVASLATIYSCRCQRQE